MPPTLRKRAAPPPAPPPAKKAAASKPKPKPAKETKPAKEPKAAKEVEPPASNPAKDESGGIPDGAGGVSSTADIDAPQETSAVAEPAPTEAALPNSKSGGAPKVGEQITLAGFGGQVETHEGKKTTLEELVKDSPAGVVLFTYPKASTPGCTTQACLFRDAYEPLTATGLRIYGLSTDSPKANTAFKTKQNLTYPLLCDPSATLIGAIGLKKALKGTIRGVFVVDKQGKVLAAEPGSPAGSVEVVKKLVASLDAAKSSL